MTTTSTTPPSPHSPIPDSSTGAAPVRATGWARLLPAATPTHLRPIPRPMRAWTAYAVFAGLYAAVFGPSIASIILGGGAQEMTAPPWPDLPFYAGIQIAQHAVMLTLVIGAAWAITRSRGLTIRDLGLWPAFTRREARWAWRRQAVAVYLWAWMAFFLVGVGMGLIAALTGTERGGALPETFDEALRLVLMMGPTTITTAVIEEIAVIAIPVLLLTAAKRPAWEVYTLTALARVGYHAYYGWPALALIPATLLLIWLYRRTGRLTPLIIAHADYNQTVTTVMLTAPYPTP